MDYQTITDRAKEAMRCLPEPFSMRHVSEAIGIDDASFVMRAFTTAGWIESAKRGTPPKNWYRRTPLYGITADARRQCAQQALDALHEAMSRWASRDQVTI